MSLTVTVPVKNSEVYVRRVYDENTEVFSSVPVTTPDVTEDFSAVVSYNEDLVAWLNIPNIGYLPVCKGIDNQFYLTHNEYKEESVSGVPFINTNSTEDVWLIHGHNMSDGSMFGNLEKYLSEDFFFNNGTLELYSDGFLSLYRPFTIFLYTENSTYIPYENSEYSYNYLKELSLYDVFWDFNLDKPILLLSTCVYFEGADRMIVGFAAVN